MKYENFSAEELKQILDDNGVAYRKNSSHETLLKLVQEIGVYSDADAETASNDEADAETASNDEAEAAGETEAAAEAETSETVSPEEKNADSEADEQAEEQAAIERPFYAVDVAGASGFPFKIRLKNDTPADRVFPELTPVGNEENFIYAYSEWREFIVENQESAETLEQNLKFYNHMEKWDNNRRIQIAAIEKD